MKNQVVTTLLILLFTRPCFPQENIQNSKFIFFELAGSGGFGSLNYEKAFSTNEKTMFTWRTGISFSPVDKNNGNAIIFPLMINSIVGKGSNKFELGLGQGITITTKGNFFALGTAFIGYRYQKETKRVFYRIGYTPLISYLVDFQIQHWAGVSVGLNLNPKEK